MVIASAPVGKHPLRRSDRIVMGLHVRVSATSRIGGGFMLSTRTLLLSRYGATILLDRGLASDSMLSISCEETNKEAGARLVGFTGEPEGLSYGIEFLDADVNLWNIRFPSLTDSETAVAPLLLQCLH